MAKSVVLTDTKIKHAKSKEKEYNLAAGNGLYLRISPNGSKSWLFNYFKPFLGTRSNIGLGKYPALSLEKAKKKRDEYHALLVENLDPKTVREVESEHARSGLNDTFEKVFREWLEIKRPEISVEYFDRIESTFNLHVLPGIENVPISKLTAPFVIEKLQPLAISRTLETLRKVCGWLNEIMVFAVNTGKILANPLAGIKKAFRTPKTTNRPSIKPDELSAFVRDLEQASITMQTRCAIEWLLHTLVRPSEGAMLMWDEIDDQRALWRIPAAKMKMKRDHIVPLTPQAFKILEVMRPISGNRNYVFPSHIRPREHMNPETPNNALKRMGYGGRLVAHGLRSLGSTTLNEKGFDKELIEVSLAHVDSSVRGDYNRANYIDRRRTIMEWWSNHIEQSTRELLMII